MLLDTWPQCLPLVKTLTRHLKERGATLATCESCTGGLLASLMTHLPGSSEVYLGGITAYANEAKIALVGVQAETLARSGAVSQETVLELAGKTRQRFQATYALAVTGIAGPGGGSPEKPVGTVWCGFATPEDTTALCWMGEGDRAQIRSGAVVFILEQFIKIIDHRPFV